MFIPWPHGQIGAEPTIVQTRYGLTRIGWTEAGTVAGVPFVRIEIPSPTAEGLPPLGRLVPISEVREMEAITEEQMDAVLAVQANDNEPF